MTTLRFAISASVIVFCLLLLTIGPSLAVEYKPDTREALLFRPEKPTQRLHAPQTCNDRPAHIIPIRWRIVDDKGSVIETFTLHIRRQC